MKSSTSSTVPTWWLTVEQSSWVTPPGLSMKTRDAINGQRNFRGRIVSVEGDTVVFDDMTSGRVKFAVSSVAKANLEIDVEEEFRRAEERERAAKQAAGSTTE